MKFLSEMISKKKQEAAADGAKEAPEAVTAEDGFDLPELASEDAAKAGGDSAEAKGSFESDDGSYDWDIDALDLSDDADDDVDEVAGAAVADAEEEPALEDDGDDLFGDFMADDSVEEELDDAASAEPEEEVQAESVDDESEPLAAEDYGDDFDLFADDVEEDDVEEADDVAAFASDEEQDAEEIAPDIDEDAEEVSFSDGEDVPAEVEEEEVAEAATSLDQQEDAAEVIAAVSDEIEEAVTDTSADQADVAAVEDAPKASDENTPKSTGSSETEVALRAALARLPGARKAIEEELGEEVSTAPKSSFISQSVKARMDAMKEGNAQPALQHKDRPGIDPSFMGEPQEMHDDNGSAIDPDAAVSPLAALRAKRQGELSTSEDDAAEAQDVMQEPVAEEEPVNTLENEPAPEMAGEEAPALRMTPRPAPEPVEEPETQFQSDEPVDEVVQDQPVSEDPEPEQIETQAAPAAASADDDDVQPVRRKTGRVKTRLLGFHKPEESADPISAARARTDDPEFPVGWLVVVKGPGRGASFTLQSGASTIGRGEDQVVRLDFGDTSISRENHAIVAYDDEQKTFFVGHGGKANLVRLNDMPVLSTEPLANTDTIRIGETTLRFVTLCDENFSWTEGPYADQTHAAE